MDNVYKALLALFLVLTISVKGWSQEFPFLHFPDKTGSLKDVLVFQQNKNKEIIYANRRGVYSFNSKEYKECLNFSSLGLSGIQKAVLTNNSIIVLSTQGLYSIKLEKPEKVLLDSGTQDFFYNSPNDEIYVSRRGNLDRLTKKGDFITVLSHFKGDEVYFGTNIIYVAGGNTISQFSIEWQFQERFNLPHPIVSCFLTEENLWVLTARGIFTREDRGFTNWHKFEKGEVPLCIREDKTGKLWVGTADKGIILFDGVQQQRLTRENNFPLKRVDGIIESEDFSLWFYGRGGIVYKSFSSPFRKFNLGIHIAGTSIQDLHELDTGKVALITKDGFLHLFENEMLKSSRSLALPFEPDFSRIIDLDKSLHVERSGKILLHTPKGNYSTTVKTDIFNVYPFSDRALIIAKDGSSYLYFYANQSLQKNIWEVSVEKPLFQSGNSFIYTDKTGKVLIWNIFRGSSLAIGAYSPEMLHAALLNEKYFVFLSNDKQLKYSVAGKVMPLGFRLGLNEKVNSFFISNSSLWISTDQRLYQIGFYLKEDMLKVLEPRKFDAKDYALDLPVFKSILNEEGSHWLATESSLIIYHSFELAPDISAPGFVLDKVFIKSPDSLVSLAVTGNDSISIRLDQKDQLFIRAFAVNYDQNNRVNLKYRFLKGDTRWKETEEEDLILIAGFQPGNHIVELLSENSQGVKSQKRKLLMLHVETPSWQNGWVLLGVSLSFILLGLLTFKGVKSLRDANSREAKEKYEKELLKLNKRSHEQMMKAEGLKQINQLISAQKTELEEKNKQIVAQKYELTLTNNQIKHQKDVIEQTTEKLQSSINYAQRIQSALMGDEILIKEDLPDSFVLFKPRDQVSGDFFWYEKTVNEAGEDVLILAAVDCTGHGVPGAIVSVVGIQLLNAIVKAKKITDPGRILTQLNLDLLDSLKFEQTQINDGMDLSICTINFKQKKIYIAGAKNPVFKIEHKELEIIKGDKFPIGGQRLRDEKDFTTHELDIKGDGSQMFFLFTDGYQDQFGGPYQSKFMAGNFKNLLIEISDKPMMEQKYMLGKTIKEWQGEEEQTDDILVMGFRI